MVALKNMEQQSESNEIDELIVPTSPLYRQILNLYAEENAIEDTIFYLGEALRRDVIDLDVFLKVCLFAVIPPFNVSLCWYWLQRSGCWLKSPVQQCRTSSSFT